MHKIGQAAELANLPVKTVRYYDEIGLISPRHRTGNGYRVYSDAEIRKLVFIQHARNFGFSIEDCRELLALYEDDGRSSAEVKKIALHHLAELKHRMAEMQSLHDELERLAHACHGDSRPDCPILESMARTET